MADMVAISDFHSGRFELFLIYKLPRYCLSSFQSVGLSVQEKKSKIDFEDGGNLGFLI